MSSRVGIGFDIHRLVPKRPLILGGVRIPWQRGLLGHSDADVLLHAVSDALLGAVGKGDIGTYFPDTDPQWKGCPSRRFVEKALQLATKARLAIANVDLIVMAESPRLAPFRDRIRRHLAKILKVKPAQVNLKARTMEGLGSIGRKEAMAAYAVVLLEKQRNSR